MRRIITGTILFVGMLFLVASSYAGDYLATEGSTLSIQAIKLLEYEKINEMRSSEDGSAFSLPGGASGAVGEAVALPVPPDAAGIPDTPTGSEGMANEAPLTGFDPRDDADTGTAGKGDSDSGIKDAGGESNPGVEEAEDGSGEEAGRLFTDGLAGAPASKDGLGIQKE